MDFTSLEPNYSKIHSYYYYFNTLYCYYFCLISLSWYKSSFSYKWKSLIGKMDDVDTKLETLCAEIRHKPIRMQIFAQQLLIHSLLVWINARGAPSFRWVKSVTWPPRAVTSHLKAFLEEGARHEARKSRQLGEVSEVNGPMADLGTKIDAYILEVRGGRLSAER